MEGVVELLSALPLPWLICVISWIACGWVCKSMWERGNTLQDKNLEDVKDYAEKLAALNAKMTDTLDALIAMHRGGKSRVR